MNTTEDDFFLKFFLLFIFYDKKRIAGPSERRRQTCEDGEIDEDSDLQLHTYPEEKDLNKKI
jgi:hypothetical protein